MYFVLEIQKQQGGTCGTLIHQAETEKEARSVYYQALAAAAISDLAAHSAVLLTDEGGLLASECYANVPEPEPPEEPEPEEPETDEEPA